MDYRLFGFGLGIYQNIRIKTISHAYQTGYYTVLSLYHNISLGNGAAETLHLSDCRESLKLDLGGF